MSDPNAYTIGWISAIELEYTAAQEFLDDSHERPKWVHQNDDNHYTLGRIGSHNVVMAVLPAGGNGIAAAAMVAKDMKHTFPNVRVGLMVGIGGGAPSERHDIRLGDVVVSAPSYHHISGNHGGVVQYDFGKTMQEGRFQSAHYLNQPPRAILTAVAGLRTKHTRKGNDINATITRIIQQNPRLRRQFGQPDPDTDVLYANDVAVERPQRTEEEDNPSVHYGLIASADAFMEDAKIRDLLAKELDVMCFEMEAAGLMNNFPCLIVRGICDYSDARWNKDWRGYAAMAAAAYAKDLIKEVMPYQLEVEKGIGQLLEPKVQLIRKAVSDNDANQETVIDRQCLRDLYITDPRDDKKRIESTKGGLLLESCNWILGHSLFRQWLEDEKSRLLWVKGDAGKGKTMLLCGIIEELGRSIKSRGQEDTTLLSYFFCQNTDSRINSASAVLRGLIYMLIDQNKMLVSHLRKEYDVKGKTLFENVNTWASLSTILDSILQDQRLQGGYIVIDALDECVTDLEPLLGFIVECSSSSRYKWVVSSRNWPNVEERLEPATQRIRLCLELNEDFISTAVDIYIRHEVDRLTQLKNYDKGTQDAVLEGLSLNSNNTFLWVALVCRELEKVQRWKAKKKLNMFPPGLDPLYDRMLDQVNHLEDVDLLKQILAIVSTVYRPVTLPELTSLMEFPDGIDDESLAEMVKLCGSFLTLRDCTIYFVHQSAKDFLLGKKAYGDLFPSGIREIHCGISSRSLEAMAGTLRTDIYNLRDPGIHVDDVKQPVPDPLSAVKYSCVYWAQHLCESDRQSFAPHRDGVLAFLREHLLHWLEALSLMRSPSRGPLAISSLQTKSQVRNNHHRIYVLESVLTLHIQAGTDVDLDDFLYDSKRFLLRHMQVMETTPLQLYNSILIFSPENSLVRKQFEKQMSSWILQKPFVPKQWDLLLRSFEFQGNGFDPPADVAFSSNSKLLALAAETDIRIWDTETGATVQILVSVAISLSFTAAGKLLSLDGVADDEDDKALLSSTVRVWDLTTGHGDILHTFDLPGLRGNLARLSPDGRFLAQTYKGRAGVMIGLWDIETRAMTRTFMGHDDLSAKLGFSPDGIRVFWSTDRDITLWDIITGDISSHLNTSSVPNTEDVRCSVISVSNLGHSVALVTQDHEVYTWITGSKTGLRKLSSPQHATYLSRHPCVAMSPNGKRVAMTLTKGRDQTLQILDAETGVVEQNLQGCTAEIVSLVFSHDSSLLASCSQMDEVRLWNADDGSGTTDVQSICEVKAIIAPDGRTMAVIRDGDIWVNQNTYSSKIELWDISKGVYLRTFECCSDPVRDILGFLPTGKRLLSSHYGSSRLWDLETSSYLRLFNGERHQFYETVFSPDGKNAASVENRPRLISLWDKRRNDFLPSCPQDISAIAFSSDGDSTALASNGKTCTISLWDAAFTSMKKRLEGHSRLVSLLKFSPNSKLLASASNHEAVKTIKLWDVATANQPREIKGHLTDIDALTFSPDSKILALTSTKNRRVTTTLWNVASGVFLQAFEHASDQSFYLDFPFIKTAFSSDGVLVAVTWLAEAGAGEAARRCDVYNVATGTPLVTFVRDAVFTPDGVVIYDGTNIRNIEKGQSFELASGNTFIKFSPGGKLFATMSDDNVVELWDIPAAKKHPLDRQYPPSECPYRRRRNPFGCQHQGFPDFVFSPNSKLLAAVLCSAIIIWDTATGAFVRLLELGETGHGTKLQVVFSPDGENVAVCRNRSITLWNFRTGVAFQVGDKVEERGIVEFSPDGNLIALSYPSSAIWLWDAETGASIRIINNLVPLGHRLRVWALAVAPGDCHHLAISRWGARDIDIWSGTPCTRTALKGHSDIVQALCFSNDGGTLLSVSRDETIRLWNIATWSTKLIFRAHPDDPFSNAVFSKDDRMIALYGLATAKLWSAETGEALKVFSAGEEIFEQLAFSPDGSYLITNRGILVVRNSTAMGPANRSRLFMTDKWISWDMKNRLRILEGDLYRHIIASPVSNVVTLINNSGQISFLELGPTEMDMVMSDTGRITESESEDGSS
ncbi:hypothetical protein CP533_6909 [Ophiocordyceps camponoti-saundersi (nom. inval.)]|nr:hypothetical protein CP533_6909 [Ophiocordyceps camponoti-saundersi (nom. inval.)]